MTRLLSVNSHHIMLWEMSFDATVSACAAAIDRHVAAVLMICFIFSFIRSDKRAKIFAQLMRDRESQLRDNKSFVLQSFNSKSENSVDFADFEESDEKKVYILMMIAAERDHFNFRDRIALQSYHKMTLFRLKEMIEQMLKRILIMMMISKLNEISLSAEQKKTFEKLKSSKKLHWAERKEHLSILSEEKSDKFLKAEIEFFKTALKSEIK